MTLSSSSESPLPIVVSAGRSNSLTAYLITLFLAKEYPTQKILLLSSIHSQSIIDSNDLIFLDVEGMMKLSQLIDWKSIQRKVSYTNIDGYCVNLLLNSQRECVKMVGKKTIIKVNDLKRAILEYLQINHSINVRLELESLDEQVGFKTLIDDKLPVMKFVNREGLQEEIISQMIIDCERKSFVLRSMLSNFNMSLAVSQTPSNYFYKQLNLPFEVLDPSMDESNIHVFSRENIILMAVPNFEKGTYMSTLFFKKSDIESNNTATDIATFFKEEFPGTFPLVGEYIMNQLATQPTESVYNYKISSPSMGKIIFVDSTDIPFFGDHKLESCFSFMQLVKDDINKYGINKIDLQLLKTSISLEQKQSDDIDYIEKRMKLFQKEKDIFVKSKNSMTTFLWNIAKKPFVAVGNHVLEVFGFKESDLSNGQKWMFRIAYGIGVMVLKHSISTYLEDRKMVAAVLEKTGTGNKLFNDLVYICVSGSCDKSKKLLWASKECLNALQIETIIGMFKYSFDRKEFFNTLITSGNIGILTGKDVARIFSCLDVLTSSDKMVMLEQLKPYIEFVSKQDMNSVLETFGYGEEKARKILETCKFASSK